jgi:hypothetical protein
MILGKGLRALDDDIRAEPPDTQTWDDICAAQSDVPMTGNVEEMDWICVCKGSVGLEADLLLAWCVPENLTVVRWMGAEEAQRRA